jgi:hypothetical protein
LFLVSTCLASSESWPPSVATPPPPPTCLSRPPEPLDALENLPREAPRQVAFGELQGEVPGKSDEPRTGLEEPQANLVGPEAVAGEPRLVPVGVVTTKPTRGHNSRRGQLHEAA